MTGVAKTASGNTLKEFNVKIARGAGGAAKPKPAEAQDDEDDDEAPF